MRANELHFHVVIELNELNEPFSVNAEDIKELLQHELGGSSSAVVVESVRTLENSEVDYLDNGNAIRSTFGVG